MKSLLIILSCAFFFITASPLRAETGTSQEKAEVRAWWGEIQTGFIFDNNIFQAKDTKDSDIIWESMILMKYQPDAIKWSGRAIFDQYQKNEELSYSSFEFGGEQPLGMRDYGSLFFDFSPTAPLDKEDPTRAPFALGSYGFSASYDRDIDSLGNVGISLSYTRLDYDSPFNAKDTDIISLSPSLFYRANDFWSFYGEYTYESGKAKAGMVAGRPDDISYQAHAVSLKGSRRISETTSLRLRYRIRKKRFTAGRADDFFHADRKDTNHSLYGILIYSPMNKLFLESRLDLLWRNSNDTFVEFNGNRFTVSIAYQF